MRPLPRLHAVTDARILAREDLIRVATRIAASAGPALAIHVRDRSLPARTLLARARQLGEVTQAAESALVVNGRADVAAAVGAQGVHLRRDDLRPAEARQVLGAAWHGWVGLSVHDQREADEAMASGADFLMLGSIFPTTTHPGRPGLGVDVLRAVALSGRPVLAIGGVTPARVASLRDAGAWGVAAITALWDAPDPGAAAVALLEPWTSAA